SWASSAKGDTCCASSCGASRSIAPRGSRCPTRRRRPRPPTARPASCWRAGGTRCRGRCRPPCRRGSEPLTSLVDRLVLVGAGLGLALALGLHISALAVGGSPAAPWSWLLHGGAIDACWWVAQRIRAAGFRGVAGLLRIRRMVPVPLRLALAAVTL